MLRSASKDADAALDRAQDVIFDAWEASTAKRRIAMAKEALAISPLCADAYVLLAEHAKRGSDEELELWRRGVEAGREALGEAAFQEYEGEFWGFLETRPYMRAKFGLARALWARGVHHEEAIGHLYEMLRLNPNDNQGARYSLAAVLVEASQDDDLARLLDDYPDDGAAAWSWTMALLAFRQTGDGPQSRELLIRALTDNEHVPAYLLGERPVPKRLPPYYSPGDENEAIFFTLDFRSGWLRTPGAIDWLKANKPSGTKSKRTRSAR